MTKAFDPDHLTVAVKKALERSRLKTEVEIVTEEIGKRFHLVPRKSPLTTHAIEEAKKATDAKHDRVNLIVVTRNPFNKIADSLITASSTLQTFRGETDAHCNTVKKPASKISRFFRRHSIEATANNTAPAACAV